MARAARDEEALIAAVAAASPAVPAAVELGIGDDAALLAGGLVLSADMLADGVHFRLGELTPRAIGQRAAGANLSDLAAMAAEPLLLLVCLGLPPGFEELEELAKGVALHGVAIAGGDLS